MPPPMMSTSTAAAAASWLEVLKGVLAESYRVVSAHSRHFLALSVLFLLPLSSLLISSPSLFLLLTSHFSPNSSSTPPQSLLRIHSSPHFHLSILLLIAILLVSLLLLLSAFSSLARSIRSGFFGRPVKLLPALSSLPSSLPRLLLTLLPISTPLLLLSSPLLLALRFLPHSPFLIFPLSFLSALPLLHLAVSWSLSFPIAILESSSGLHPLRRSAHLVRGMRPVAVFLSLLFAPGIVLILWQCGLGEVRAFAGWREALPVVVRTVFGSALTAVLLLYWMVSSVVMYLYCKAVHGELAAEIAEEFAGSMCACRLMRIRCRMSCQSFGSDQQASFFIAYVVTSWTSLSSELTRLIPLIGDWIGKHCCSCMDDDFHTPSIQYHSEIPRILLFGLLGLAYFLLAPLILPFILVFFCIGYIVYRNQLLNVYSPKYETGGRFWPTVHNSTIFSLVLMQTIAIGIFGLKKLPLASGLILSLPVFTLLFNDYCRKRFLPIFQAYPAEILIKKDREEQNDPATGEFFHNLVTAYRDPALMPIQHSLGSNERNSPLLFSS